MSNIDPFTQNAPDSPFRDPVDGETAYVTPETMREFALAIQADLANLSESLANAGSAEWTFNDTIATPPGGGQVRMDNLDQSLVTTIYFSNMTVDGIDVTRALASIGTDKLITLQDKDDSTRFVQFRTNADAISDPEGFTEVTVDLVEIDQPLAVQRIRVVFQL